VTSRTLLAIGREDLRNQVLATMTELGDDIDLLGVAENSQDLILAIETNQDVDLVLIDDQIGSLPYLALTREVVTRSADIGVILLTNDPDTNTFQAAMDAGARAVVESPPSVGDLAARLPSIVQWQRQVRSLGNSLGATGIEASGRMIAFAGAKGGVGTSTLALHTALLAAAANPERRVCLIDLDLQQRGLRQMLSQPARRSIADLTGIADSLTGRNLDEASIVHRTGLRVLMAPEHGEQSEDVEGPVARQVLAAAKGHFDLVVVDAGSVVSEASAIGMEFADDLVLVTTPDIASLRSAQDKLELLNRLQIEKDGSIRLLFNKVSRDNEVQPEFGSRMSLAQVTRVSVPEDWRRLEPAVNALAPTDIEDGPFRRAVLALAGELRLASDARPAAPSVAEPQPSRRKRRREREKGQVTIEAVVGIAVAMVILLVLLQTALMALGTVVSKRAASEAALVGSRGGELAAASQAARDRTPGFYDVSIARVSDTRFKATVRAPTIVPWVNRDVSATASAATEE
jgi:pilus assembly protein CpaE